MLVTVKDLEEKLKNIPDVSGFHFPSWDYLYMRDIDKLRKWISEFSETFFQFEKEVRERLAEIEGKPADASAVQALKEILG